LLGFGSLKGAVSSNETVYACIISSEGVLFLPSRYTTFGMASRKWTNTGEREADARRSVKFIYIILYK